MSKCESHYKKDYRCQEEEGHGGPHWDFEPRRPGKRIYWNDNGEEVKPS